MKVKNHITGIFAVCLAFWAVSLNAQERVYVSTDKNCYLAGEDIWFSVFCNDGSNKRTMSSMAYIEFHSAEGIASTVKVALKEGRGCGRFRIPFSFATGNYSMVSYTAKDGGDSKGEFAGKIVTVFNTLTGERVKGGVEVVGSGEAITGNGVAFPQTGGLSVHTGAQGDGVMPVKISNTLKEDVSLSVSVYHMDPVQEMIGEYGYSSVPLKQRTGEFAEGGKRDYAGEVVKAKIKDAAGKNAAGEVVYMSAVGNTDDVYVAFADENGVVTFYTNNIYGSRDLVFEVGADTSKRYEVEVLPVEAKHVPADIPVLKLSEEMSGVLKERGVSMQIARRFEADTIFDLMDMREHSFVGNVTPKVYNLDEYTRFPIMEEVIREYVQDLRARKEGGKNVLKVLWDAAGQPLVLLDGVPVQDHSTVIKMDPLLVKQIVVYPRRYVLNNFTFEGMVKFVTYKGDMGGVKLPENVSVQSFEGASYPLAFLGGKVYGNGKYPNFNNTVYWNPAVTVGAGGEFDLKCVLPDYKGKFKVVVEGVDSNGNGVYATGTFNVE